MKGNYSFEFSPQLKIHADGACLPTSRRPTQSRELVSMESISVALSLMRCLGFLVFALKGCELPPKKKHTYSVIFFLACLSLLLFLALFSFFFTFFFMRIFIILFSVCFSHFRKHPDTDGCKKNSTILKTLTSPTASAG